MQLSTTLFYDSASRRMSTLASRAATLQTQISTGKRVQSPSDDAVASQQIAELDRRDADAAVYKKNLALAGSTLDQTDSTLKQINDQLQRARELTTKASSGTFNASDRKIIADELKSIVKSLVGLANTRDVRGQPLLGNTDGTNAVTDNGDGTFTFAATNVSEVPIADGQTVQTNENASRVFQVGGTNTLAIISQFAAALDTGGDITAASKTALDGLNAAGDQLSAVRASVGARGARVDLQESLLTTANTDRAALRESIEDVDITAAVTELQKTMTILSATQASFSKLSNLSLFDYLR